MSSLILTWQWCQDIHKWKADRDHLSHLYYLNMLLFFCFTFKGSCVDHPCDITIWHHNTCLLQSQRAWTFWFVHSSMEEHSKYITDVAMSDLYLHVILTNGHISNLKFGCTLYKSWIYVEIVSQNEEFPIKDHCAVSCLPERPWKYRVTHIKVYINVAWNNVSVTV